MKSEKSRASINFLLAHVPFCDLKTHPVNNKCLIFTAFDCSEDAHGDFETFAIRFQSAKAKDSFYKAF